MCSTGDALPLSSCLSVYWKTGGSSLKDWNSHKIESYASTGTPFKENLTFNKKHSSGKMSKTSVIFISCIFTGSLFFDVVSAVC